MTPLPILLAAVFLRTGNCSSKIFHGSVTGAFSSNSHLDVRRSLSEISESFIEIFWDEVFMVRNTVKNRQS